MTALDRLAALSGLDAPELCTNAETALAALVEVMNSETTLLRAGRMREAGEITAQKTQLAQDYVMLARAVQREAVRLKAEAPDHLDRLRRGHEALATQMAENLRVLATARSVTEDLLNDVAASVGQTQRAKTYGASGQLTVQAAAPARGISINRAL